MSETKAVSLAAWKKAKLHYPLLPSGMRAGIVIPDLPAMIESGQIPQHLLEVAIGVANGSSIEPSVDLLKQQREFTDVLVKKMVKEPELSDADLAEIPFEDKDFLVALGTRQRDLDAEGEHIAGLSSSEKFRRFRGLGEFEPNVESL